MLIQDTAKLEKLHKRLTQLSNDLNNSEIVPERYASTARANLAEQDQRSLAEAQMVVHRLMLWAQYPTVSPESYVGTTEVPS